MRRLLIATTNPAKIAEYRWLLREFELELVSPADVGIADKPEEAGETFAENARLKARFYFSRGGIPTLADDGGLEIDALGGEPGVRSHRWLGGAAENPDAELVAEVICRMRGVPEGRRQARIRAAIALKYSDHGQDRERLAEAALDGVIAPEAYREIRPGFPYRSVLFLPDRGCYLAELGEEEEARIGQRRKALETLASALKRLARTA